MATDNLKAFLDPIGFAKAYAAKHPVNPQTIITRPPPNLLAAINGRRNDGQSDEGRSTSSIASSATTDTKPLQPDGPQPKSGGPPAPSGGPPAPPTPPNFKIPSFGGPSAPPLPTVGKIPSFGGPTPSANTSLFANISNLVSNFSFKLTTPDSNTGNSVTSSNAGTSDNSSAAGKEEFNPKAVLEVKLKSATKDGAKEDANKIEEEKAEAYKKSISHLPLVQQRLLIAERNAALNGATTGTVISKTNKDLSNTTPAKKHPPVNIEKNKR